MRKLVKEYECIQHKEPSSATTCPHQYKEGDCQRVNAKLRFQKTHSKNIYYSIEISR